MEMQPSLSQNKRRQKSSSGDSFSFPRTPNQEEPDFEFGSLTPDSPSCTTSPADHIFFNGHLQPHSFPLSHSSFQKHYLPAAVATTSRTSSIGSKDSLLSSRSNSTSSSARTSSSDSSERRLFNNSMVSDRHHHRIHNRPSGCSQRWQYITPVPTLNRDASKKRREMHPQLTKRGEKKKKKNTVSGVPLRFSRRIFRWFFKACRQCHAMEPTKADKETVGCKKL